MNSMYYDIRNYQDTDLASLANIYSSSIRHLCGGFYSKEQITAWSSFPDDMNVFKTWLKRATTYVAVSRDDACIGFGGIESHGRISSLFVAPESGRKGIGSSVLARLLDEARLREFAVVTTEASELSRPLFEKFGFSVTAIEYMEFKDVKFSRYVMRVYL